MDTDMQYGHGQASWTWTHSTALVMQHGSDNGHAWMPECRNADKQLSPASLVFRKFTMLSPASAFQHHGQSGTASHGLVR
jgi:hypothetical protein